MSAYYKSCFGTVANDSTRIVIFGSLPGGESLKLKQYYAHHTNQFWRLVGSVIGMDLHSHSYEKRLAELLAARIGLWDVIATARRAGSADSAIRDHSPNALQHFADSLPSLRVLAFNGGTPFGIGVTQLARPSSHTVVELPSSSGSNTHMTFEEKLNSWMSLKAFLG